MKAIVGTDNVLTSAADMAAYECDGFTIAKTRPDVVVFPTSTEHIVGIVKACNELGVGFLARGAGTSLAGGCVLVGGGVMIGIARMKRILEINVRDRYAVVEPGVVNVWLTNAAQAARLPLRSRSRRARGRAPSAATSRPTRGGPHTLKYGVTVNHILGVELVLPDGSVVQCGGPCEDKPGYDLTGTIVGSEGTFGVVSKVWVRLTRNPEAYRTLLGVFETVDDATNTISDIIGAGIVPAALEMLDRTMVSAVEAAFKFGFPLDAEAVVIMEVDGLAAGIQERGRPHRGHRHEEQGPRGAQGEHRGRTDGAVEGPQAGVRDDRPARLPELLHAGRRGAANEAAARSCGTSRRPRRSTASASATCSTPATATSTRS